MKCPQCPANFSELRDLCPQCLADLREFKREAGLPVTAPDASYADLLRKNLKRTGAAQASNSQDASGSVQEVVNRVRFVIGPRGSSPATSKPHVSPPATSNPMDIAPASAPQAAQASPDAPTPRPAREVPPVPKAPARVAASASHTQGQAIAAVDYANASEAQLFEDAQRTLGNSYFELGAEQLLRVPNPDEVAILFELADEAIFDPLAATRYQTEITRSDTRQVEASGLAARLKQIERLVERPMLGLRQLRGQQAAHTASLNPQEVLLEVKQASLESRVLGASYHYAVLALLACALCAFYGHWSESLSIRWDFSDMRATAPALALSMAALLITIPVLGGLWGALGWSPIAFPLAGLALVCENGRPARAANLVVRALCAPLSIMCFGWLPLLWGRQPLHDRLARTVLVARSEYGRLQAHFEKEGGTGS